MRCKSLPDTLSLSKIKTGLLQTLQGSERLPGSIDRLVHLDEEDLLGVLEPLEQEEPVM